MLLDYKDIITKRYALHMSLRGIAADIGASKSGVGDFLEAFAKCPDLEYPLPLGITNEGIALKVYGKDVTNTKRDESYEYPDYALVANLMKERNNMTLVACWQRYQKRCEREGKKYYQYRQFCEHFRRWCTENYETAHFNAVIGQSMEVDFAGKTFEVIDRVTSEVTPIVVFVAVLAYSQYIYAEGMTSTKEAQWIEVHNHALTFFEGVPPLIICDNCKQAVITNKDWIEPELNKDYAEWAEHNHTAILPAKVRKPKFKSSVECSVGILEKGIFHILEERRYFSLDDFNQDLWELLDELNRQPFKKKEHSRLYYFEEEKQELLPLPSTQYHYMERATAKVSSDFHIRFDNAYYSVDKDWLHKKVKVRADATTVKIYSLEGDLIQTWPRSYHKGEWKTDPNHLPHAYKDYSEWNSTYFIRRASHVGPKTQEVIEYILKSRTLEVQTYRLCIGVLGFSKKYGALALEECARRAIEAGHISYTFIKNTIGAVSEELSQKNKGDASFANDHAYLMDSSYKDMGKLLERSVILATSESEAK